MSRDCPCSHPSLAHSGPHLSCEIHSKSCTLTMFSLISLLTTSLAWTSMTMSAESTARCMRDSFPRTRATRSLS